MGAQNPAKCIRYGENNIWQGQLAQLLFCSLGDDRAAVKFCSGKHIKHSGLKELREDNPFLTIIRYLLS